MANAPQAAVEFEREKWRAELKLDREKWREEKAQRQRDHVLKEREQTAREDELDIKKAELDIKKNEARMSRWTNPLVLAIIGATLTGLLNVISSAVNNYYQLQLEDKKSAATLALERTKSEATLNLEEKKSNATLALEVRKAEAARILEMIKTGDPDKAAVNLKFLVDSGLITEGGLSNQIRDFLEKRQPGTGPFLTTAAAPPTLTTYSCNSLAARIAVPQGYMVAVSQTSERCVFSVNGAGENDVVISCGNTNARAYVPSTASVSKSETRNACLLSVNGAVTSEK